MFYCCQDKFYKITKQSWINNNTDAGLHVVIELVGEHIYIKTLCVCVCVCTQDSWGRFFSSSFHAPMPSLTRELDSWIGTHTHIHRVIVYICSPTNSMTTWRPASVLLLIYGFVTGFYIKLSIPYTSFRGWFLGKSLVPASVGGIRGSHPSFFCFSAF